MITYIKLVIEDPERITDNKIIELRSGEKVNLTGNFWPREIKFLNDIVAMTIEFNKNEKGHRGIKDDKS